jgi:Basic region leucine zipper
MDISAGGFLSNSDDCILLPDEDSLDLCVDFLVSGSHGEIRDSAVGPAISADQDLWADTFEDDMSSNHAADAQSCHDTVATNPELGEEESLHENAELDIFSFPDLPDGDNSTLTNDKLSFDGRNELDWEGIYPEHMQENRQSSANNVLAHMAKNRGISSSENSQMKVYGKGKPEDVLGAVPGKFRDKSTQRKLRNKESARRYREKQVAKRRQLEDYTRSLAEQNRELESLHERLLTLTCDAQMAK